MEERPKLKLELTKTDKIVEITGWFSVAAIWSLIIITYNNLPNIIPIHYNITGEINRHGGKINILLLPLTATVIFVGLTILNKFPHIFNYLNNITKENALRYYTEATKLIRSLKLLFVIIFGFLEFGTIQVATGKADGLGTWFLLSMIGVCFIPLLLINFYVKSSRVT